MSENPAVLSLDLEAVSGDGSKIPFTLEVGRPYLELQGQWRCVVEMGEFRRPLRIAGADPFQALTIAIDYARWLLQDFKDQGGSLNCEGENFPLDAYFFKPPT